MEYYANMGGRSGVAAYEIEPGKITVQFRDGAIYEYTSLSAGAQNIEQMTILAQRGEGLNSFINTTVRKRYSRKIR